VFPVLIRAEAQTPAAWSCSWQSPPVHSVPREEIQPHLDIDAWRDLFPFQRSDALFKQLAVQVEADRCNMAALLGPQKIAGTANFQIAHGDFKSASQSRVLLNRA
jgi:hypothetical protein